MPSSSYDVAFVDSIVANPTIRLDLHTQSGGWECLADGTEFPPPPLDRVMVQSMLADGAPVPWDAYRNRSITLALELPQDLDPDAAATLMQALMREIDRPGGNFLRYRTDTTMPVFFRTFRSGPDAIDWNPFTRRASVTLLAKPFAFGLEETQGPFTVTNNPAAGTNGQYFDITSPKGDVETPLTLTIGNGLGATGRLRSALSIRRRGTVANTPLVLQAEAMTQGADTSIQANSASFSGSGSNWSRCTFATLTSGQRRIYTSTTFPTASVDARGEYRVYIRGRQTVASDSIDVRLQYGDANAVKYGPIVRWPGNTGIQYIDLGVVLQIPVGYDPVYDNETGVEIAPEGTYLDLYVRRNSGSGNFDMDLLLFLPADDGLEHIKWPTIQPFSSDTYVATGGEAPQAYLLTNSGTIRSVETIEISGGGLFITPGRTNRVFFARDVGTGTAAAGGGDSLTATNTITASYMPRYLSPVRPVST